MAATYTAVLKKSGEWWIGWIEEVRGVNCQEHTRERLLETLQITLREALAWESDRDSASAESGFEREPIVV